MCEIARARPCVRASQPCIRSTFGIPGRTHVELARHLAHRALSAMPGRIQPPCSRRQCSLGSFRQCPGLTCYPKTPRVCVLILTGSIGEVCAPHLPGMMQSLGNNLLPRRKLKRKHVRFFAKAGRRAGLDQGAVGAHQCLDAVGHISAYICLSCLTPAPRSLAPGHPQPKLLARAPG